MALADGSTEEVAQQAVKVLRAVFRGLEEKDRHIAELQAALIDERARYLYARDWSSIPVKMWEPWENEREKYRATARRGLIEDSLLPEPGELE